MDKPLKKLLDKLDGKVVRQGFRTLVTCPVSGCGKQLTILEGDDGTIACRCGGKPTHELAAVAEAAGLDVWDLEPQTAARPTPASYGFNPGTIPAELRALKQWLCWGRRGATSMKDVKIPWCVDGTEGSSTDPATWRSFDEAVAAVRQGDFSGIGFVFSGKDSYAGIDLDHVLTSENDDVRARTAEVLEMFPATYAEVSPSGDGLHLFVKAEIANGRQLRPVEMYSSGRYFTMTGRLFGDRPRTIGEYQAEATALWNTLEDSRRTTVAFGNPGDIDSKRLKVEDYLNDYGVLFRGPSERDGAVIWDLVECPFAADHTDPGDGSGACVMQFASGATSFKCHHTSCASLGWEAFRAKIGPPKDEHWLLPTGVRSDRPRRPRPSMELRRELTDQGNGRKFIERYGEDFAYCPELGGWLAWAGDQWTEKADTAVSLAIGGLMDQLWAEALAEDDPNGIDSRVTWAVTCGMQHRHEALVRHLRARYEQPLKLFDQDPWILNVQNGVVDLKLGALRSHCREDYCTQQAAVAYDPAAACPRWEAFIDWCFNGNKKMVRYVQQLLGYSLTGVTDAQILPILYGTGANGKSTVINTLTEILGGYATLVPSLLFVSGRGNSNEHQVARMVLRGKRFAAAVETGDDNHLNEVAIKELCSSDLISARVLYTGYVSFPPVHKLWFACNEIPSSQGVDKGLWRRLRFVEFANEVQDEARDTDLGRKLLTEVPGILNWLIAGCLDWQKNGFQEPPEVTQFTRDIRIDMDVVGQFIAGCCIVEPGNPNLSCSMADLYQAYKLWCHGQGIKPIGCRVFGKKLTTKKISSVHTMVGTVRYGINLTSDARARVINYREWVEKKRRNEAGENGFGSYPNRDE